MESASAHILPLLTAQEKAGRIGEARILSHKARSGAIFSGALQHCGGSAAAALTR